MNVFYSALHHSYNQLISPASLSSKQSSDSQPEDVEHLKNIIDKKVETFTNAFNTAFNTVSNAIVNTETRKTLDFSKFEKIMRFIPVIGTIIAFISHKIRSDRYNTAHKNTN